jgi:hypothetical protein
MQAHVTEIGKTFEFHKANFAKDSVDEVSRALHELYKLFNVQPVAKRVLHDGKSPITTKEKTWQKRHQELWELLVPSSGSAETIQGEVIRITGRISNELEGNGGANWDADYKKMCDAFLAFVRQGTPLSSSDLAEAEVLAKEVKRGSGDTDRMSELAVNWVIDNPTPVKLGTVEYKR